METIGHAGPIGYKAVQPSAPARAIRLRTFAVNGSQTAPHINIRTAPDMDKLRILLAASAILLALAPAAAKTPSAEMDWSIEESKSPPDDSLQVVAAMVSGDTALILRCKEQNTEAAFSTKFNYLGSKSVKVLVRINDEEPTPSEWRSSTTGRAAFAPNAEEFIRALPDNGKLFLRAVRFDGKIKDANFKLGAVSAIKDKIASACNWPDASKDEPVGSVGH
jgi:hypothetical protein